ncbi:putative arginase [Gleimia coleocanis DSM 15436]|uniref:Arginase n=1 Tax=Gleimia coleocanis DSM 15436 TaxID=525245 RepID=C0W095_9ACTO|nr:arginase [Gleimia coleocanis]EEH63954.1 putative arginase [Gleimia coleocanis DSM 15436]
MLKVIGCNNHLGETAPGLAGNLTRLQELNPQLDLEVVAETVCEHVKNDPRLKNFESVVATSENLAKVSQEKHAEKLTPLHILGDHAAAMGTVAAASASVETLGVIWIDAHADINTESTTPSGHIHGMPIAALLGITESVELNDLHFAGPKFKPEHMVYIGLRDVDPGEKVYLEKLGILHYYWDEVVERGLAACLEEIVKHFQAVDRVHVSLDLDSMDPELIPGVSVPVPGGFTPADTHQILRALLENTSVCSLDLVEYNPELDVDDVSAKYVLETVELIREYYK